jgi:hypothetical protein
MNHQEIVGRLCQTPLPGRRFTERSGGDASDTDGQAAGRVSGRARVKRPTIFVRIGVHSWLKSQSAGDPAHLGLRERLALLDRLFHCA